MLVICAWCEEEGKVNILEDVPGDEDKISHGMCVKHQKAMMKELRKENPSRKRPLKTGWGGRKPTKHNKDGEHFLYKLQKIEENIMSVQVEMLHRMARSDTRYIDISPMGFTNIFRQFTRLKHTVVDTEKLFGVAARSRDD